MLLFARAITGFTKLFKQSRRPVVNIAELIERSFVAGTIEALESRVLLAVTPVPFQHFTIDSNPCRHAAGKYPADIDGDGNLDAIVGFNNPWRLRAGSSGISIRIPAIWLINGIAIPSPLPAGRTYEDMIGYDMEGNGVEDIIASYNSQLVWFENPRNTGGDPTKGPWTMHVIGPDAGHEIVLGDFDGDGKIDIATRLHIYFQNSTTSWTTISTADYGNHVEIGTALFDSGLASGAVDIAGTSPNGLQIGWYENPRDHGGNARTGPVDLPCHSRSQLLDRHQHRHHLCGDGCQRRRNGGHHHLRR